MQTQKAESPGSEHTVLIHALVFDHIISRSRETSRQSAGIRSGPSLASKSLHAHFRGKIKFVKRKIESTRIIRGRSPARDVTGWETSSPDERLEAVWDLTRSVMEWSGHGESRLQRSVCRVQRSQR